MSGRFEQGVEAMRAQMDARVVSYLSSCVHCGICAEACLFFTETGDPRYTPIHKTEPMRKLWSQEYTFWGKLGRALGLSKPLTDQELADWETLVYDGCTLCGRCSMVCPVGNDIAYMIRKLREGMAVAGHAPAGLVGATTRAIQIGSPMGVKLPALQAQIRGVEAEGILIALDLSGVAASSGIRACVGLIMVDFPTAYADNPDQYFAKGLALHDEYRHHPLVRNAFAPHAPYTVSDAPLKKVQVLADELDIPVHIHLHETASEVEESRARTGQRPLERLETLGLLSPALSAVHMTQLQDDEIARLAAAGASVVHCPESNLKLASGFCPVQKLRDAGVNVALGTDGAASNNDLDMLGEMRTAALLAKAVYNDAAALPAHAVLRMATLNGAHALGMGEETGSLIAGKWADIAAVDLGTLETQPLYDPVSQLVYSAGRDQVSDVWINGRQLLKDGRHTTLDVAAVKHQAAYWSAKIAAAD